MSDEDRAEPMRCRSCGAELDADARFCPGCGAETGGEALKKRRLPRLPVAPWAVGVGERVKKVPRSIKIGVPVVVLLIIAVIVTLFSLAAAYSPRSAVEAYLSHIKEGDYGAAHDMIIRTGRFTALDYFEKWQTLQADRLGELKEFSVRPSTGETRLFGKLIMEEKPTGSPFVATLVFREKSYNINVHVEEAGGVWPVRRYKLRLAELDTRVSAAPIGTRVYIDGVYAGKSKQSKFLKDALSLKDLPGGFGEFVDYVKSLKGTVEGAVEEFKGILKGLSGISDDLSHVFDKFGKGGISWSEVTDSFERVIEAGQGFWNDLAQTVINIYWVFGGSDDGTLRAELSRTDPGVDIKGLPEGFHELTAELPGLKTKTEYFYAPEDVRVSLAPTFGTAASLKDTMNRYFQARSNAFYSLDTAPLYPVAAGDVLEADLDRIEELKTRDQRIASSLKSLKFDRIKMLSGTVATVDTEEIWDRAVYEGEALKSDRRGIKDKIVYTLKWEDDTWKVIESKER